MLLMAPAPREKTPPIASIEEPTTFGIEENAEPTAPGMLPSFAVTELTTGDTALPIFVPKVVKAPPTAVSAVCAAPGSLPKAEENADALFEATLTAAVPIGARYREPKEPSTCPMGEFATADATFPIAPVAVDTALDAAPATLDAAEEAAPDTALPAF